MPDHLALGLALGSGGARGLSHAGVLQALEEAGVRPDLVVGTSMGAIVGGLYAQEPDPESVWSRLETYVHNEDFASYWAPFVPHTEDEARDPQSRLAGVFDFMQRKLIAVKTVTRLWQQSSERLRDPLLDLFGPVDFEDLSIPFAAVALDLVEGDKVVYHEGSLVDGVYASCAIPGVFPPVRSDGRMIVDGGGPYRVPVDACRDLGADLVVAVDIPAFEETVFSTGMDLILRSNTVARQRLNRFVLTRADFVIRPEVSIYHWADFAQGEQVREAGYEAGKAAVPELQKLLRERSSLGYRMKRALALKLGLD